MPEKFKEKFNKSFLDPIYGNVPLTAFEYEVTRTPVFQRLRKVGQLTLASDLYSGANYTRLAHSVGACHEAGLLMDALANNGSRELDDNQRKIFRLAALLHDIGHYPFSHPMERAIKRFLDERSQTDRTSAGQDSAGAADDIPSMLYHEDVGRVILGSDNELSRLLRREDINPNDVASAFKHDGGGLRNLVSSDLDADRLDYLQRNAHHTGLPYGHVDAVYLIDQVRIDGNENPFLPVKAISAADHFFIGRLLDYQKVPFHKTIVALEAVLEDVLVHLLSLGAIPAFARDVIDRVQSGEWAAYDDAAVYAEMRSALKGNGTVTSSPELVQDKIISILERKPPKLLAEAEWYDRVNDQRIFDRSDDLKLFVSELAERSGLEPGRIFIWINPGEELTSVGLYPGLPATETAWRRLDAKRRKLVRVPDRESGEFIPINESKRSLMSILTQYAWFALRVYYIPRRTDALSLRDELSIELMNRFRWIESWEAPTSG